MNLCKHELFKGSKCPRCGVWQTSDLMPPKTMTPTSNRAEEIMAAVLRSDLSDDGAIKMIVKALDNYAREAVKNAVLTMTHNEGVAIAREEGAAEMRERAAKFKEDACSCYADGSAGCGGTCEDFQDAKGIRALPLDPGNGRGEG